MFRRMSPAFEGLKVTGTRPDQSILSSLSSHSVKLFLYTTKSNLPGSVCAE